jgi:predicted restriction endonuclease
LGERYKITKGELFKARGYFNARSLIQGHALSIWKRFGTENMCSICRYDKYTEVCHIKAVSSFSDNATILEINNISNLISLCPNHHWEYDHGILKL